MSVTSHLSISGRVQGVGFRFALHREALARGLAGWVRNRHDGTVEAVLQGEAAAVAAVVAWARRGPPGARVDHVAAAEAKGEFARAYAKFEQLPTE